jgi:hypothetical protein
LATPQLFLDYHRKGDFSNLFLGGSGNAKTAKEFLCSLAV